MSENITIARPYAQAAFQYAVENNDVDAWQNMLALSTALSDDSSMKSILISDRRSSEIATLFIQMLGNELDDSGRNFIKLMAYNGRLSLLPEVLTLFLFYRQEKEKRVEIEVISASALTTKQLDAIQQSMESRLNKSVVLSEKIDESLISGFILRAGDLVIDSSIKGRLNRLSVTLQS